MSAKQPRSNPVPSPLRNVVAVVLIADHLEGLAELTLECGHRMLGDGDERKPRRCRHCASPGWRDE